VTKACTGHARRLWQGLGARTPTICSLAMPGRLSTVLGRGIAWLVVACALGATVVHVVGWGFAAVVALPDATMYWLEPASVAMLVLGAILTWAAQSLSRAARRRVVLAGLAATMLSFVTLTIPPLRFHDQNYMNDGADNIESREKFDRRFPIVVRSEMNFHSHLGDLVMRALDRRFGATPKGTARAYATLSSLAGAMFVIELLVVGWWHGFSRRICRYVGLAIASPLALLYSGFYELGYLAVCASSLPLLAVRRRSDLRETGAALCAGLLQGLHTALHGFGLIGLAGGALSLIVERGPVVRRGVRTLAYASAGVAMYLGWVFIYVVGMHISIVVENALTGFGLRHLFETVVLDRRYAYPVFSANGLAEIGLIGLLAGVPLFVLGCVKASRASLPTAAAYALPGLVFLIVWWPPGAPHNVDLLLTAFPGLFVGAWLLARRSRSAWSGLVMMAALHVLFWTNAGSRMMPRTWLEP
jgi:hypothetical protein